MPINIDPPSKTLTNSAMSPLFQAAVEAIQEAVYNAILKAKTVSSSRGILKEINIIQVKEIPRTRSGKIVELAVKKAVQGEIIDNTSAIANPECLEYFKNLIELEEGK